MRGVAVILLALALEVSYLASYRSPVQTSSEPRAAIITDADETRIGDVLAAKFAVNRGIAPTPQSQSIEKYLQMVGERVAANAQRQLPYCFHYDADPRFARAQSRFRAGTSLWERESWPMWIAKTNWPLCLGMRLNILRLISAGIGLRSS
jgi:hypothetical protein